MGSSTDPSSRPSIPLTSIERNSVVLDLPSSSKQRSRPKEDCSVANNGGVGNACQDFQNNPMTQITDQTAIVLPTLPSEEDTFTIVHRWNRPRVNIFRLASIFFAFINFGMNDAAFGPLLPYIQKDYDLSYTVASLVFLAPFVGYTFAALISDRLHLAFGQRGLALISPLTKLIAYIVICCHPPFPVVVAFLPFAGISNGLLDGAWNAWVGTMDQASQVMGLLHGCYGAGAVISPSIATAMVTRYGLQWYQFFYIMAGLMVAETAVCSAAFWTETGLEYRRKARSSGVVGENDKGMTRSALKRRTTWVAAIFLFTYMGVEVSVGGYIVVFMTEVRRAQPFSSGMSATGFWLGVTVGRIVLGFVTPRIGDRLAVIIYLVCAVGVELVFWLVPQFIVSAIAIALVGFFIGPFFPSAVLMVSRLLPRELHVAAIGFSSALGGSGAALLPFVVGAIAQTKGVQTLQPIVLAFLAIMLGIWLCFPKKPKHAHEI